MGPELRAGTVHIIVLANGFALELDDTPFTSQRRDEHVVN